MTAPKKVVLAYSGGLDTSIILKWLQTEYGCEVVTFTADLGQGEELEPARKKAELLGIKPENIYIEDVREEFVRDFVFPMFRANAVYEGLYLLGTSIARPLISKRLVEIAEETGADAVAHGATGKGNDQVRFELAYYHFDPSVKVIAPWREWDLNSRTALEEYARKHGIPVPTSKKFPWSSDRNLLHISFEGDVLEDPWAEAPEEMYVLTVRPEDAPDQPEYVEIEFEKGNAVAVNGEQLSPAKLLARLNELGGRHGIGRVDLMENRFVGMKSRGVYETPAGTILHRAREAVEQARELGISSGGELRVSYRGHSENIQTLSEQTLSNSLLRLSRQEERWRLPGEPISSSTRPPFPRTRRGEPMRPSIPRRKGLRSWRWRPEWTTPAGRALRRRGNGARRS